MPIKIPADFFFRNRPVNPKLYMQRQRTRMATSVSKRRTKLEDSPSLISNLGQTTVTKTGWRWHKDREPSPGQVPRRETESPFPAHSQLTCGFHTRTAFILQTRNECESRPRPWTDSGLNQAGRLPLPSVKSLGGNR